VTPARAREIPFSARDRRTGYLLAAPAGVLLFGVALFPILFAAWLSLHRIILVLGERRFVGLANYGFLLHDPRFWTALGNTAYFAVFSVTVELALGLAFAHLLVSAAPGQRLLRATILIPWAIPAAVSGKIWAWLFNPEYGLITRVGPGTINWLGTPGYAMPAAIVVDVWKTVPFVTLLVFAALLRIPEDLYRAAQLDGASSWRIFRSITLPLLKPTLAVVLVLRTLDAFRVFDAIYVLTAGGPANTTETLAIYTYKTLMDAGDFGHGSTLAIATFLCVLVISLVYLRLLGPEGRG
jgi:multiple sugar transport system permease protein